MLFLEVWQDAESRNQTQGLFPATSLIQGSTLSFMTSRKIKSLAISLAGVVVDDVLDSGDEVGVPDGSWGLRGLGLPLDDHLWVTWPLELLIPDVLDGPNGDPQALGDGDILDVPLVINETHHDGATWHLLFEFNQL